MTILGCSRSPACRGTACAGADNGATEKAVTILVGSVVGFCGTAVFSVWLLAWGAGLHKQFKQHLFLAANVLLVVLGYSYLARAYYLMG